MPEYTVYWTAEVHGSCTVEAADEDAAQALVEETGEGVELSNIHEILDVQVKNAEWFQD